MKITKPNKLIGLIALIGLLISCNTNPRSKALDNIVERKDVKVQALYFYPSTIRALGSLLDDSENFALSEIESARVLFSWAGEEDINSINRYFPELIKEVESEDFEMLMRMKESGRDINIYTKESSPNVHLLFLKDEYGAYIFEIVGNLSVESMRELSKLDFQEAATMFNISPPEEESPKQEDESNE